METLKMIKMVAIPPIATTFSFKIKNLRFNRFCRHNV